MTNKNVYSRLLFFRIADVPGGRAEIIKIETNTIHGFMNREKDILLVSCLRNRDLASPEGFQRFCSTLSRAKYCLIIFGRFTKVSKVKVIVYFSICILHKFFGIIFLFYLYNNYIAFFSKTVTGTNLLTTQGMSSTSVLMLSTPNSGGILSNSLFRIF